MIETKQEKAMRDLGYEIVKALGIIWLIKKIPFLELKPWVAKRDKQR